MLPEEMTKRELVIIFRMSFVFSSGAMCGNLHHSKMVRNQASVGSKEGNRFFHENQRAQGPVIHVPAVSNLGRTWTPSWQGMNLIHLLMLQICWTVLFGQMTSQPKGAGS